VDTWPPIVGPKLDEDGFWKFFEKACLNAVELFERDGEHAAMIFLFSPQGTVLVPWALMETEIRRQKPDIDDQTVNEGLWGLVNQAAERVDASGYVHILEAWAASIPLNGDRWRESFDRWKERHPGSIEEISTRVEVLMVRAVWKDRQMNRSWSINRRDSGVYLSRGPIWSEERQQFSLDEVSNASRLDRIIRESASL